MAMTFFISMVACNKKTPLGPQVINSSLIFLVKKNNQQLPDSILSNMKMSFYQNGSKLYQQDFVRAVNEGPFYGADLGVMGPRNIGVTSGDNGVKDYYLGYPDGSRDTLFVDYQHVNYNEAKNNSCYCYYPLVGLRFNGQVPSLDSSIKEQNVYLFKKR